GQYLDSTQKLRARALYATDARAAYDCRGANPPTVPSSCDPGPGGFSSLPDPPRDLSSLNAMLRLCSRLALGDAYPCVVLANYNDCLDLLGSINSISDDAACQRNIYRTAYFSYVGPLSDVPRSCP